MKRKAWTIVIIGFLAGVSLALAQNKVAPTITFIINDLNISMAMAGWLSSIFCVMGMVVAVPSAFILNRFGTKKSGLMALSTAIIGSIIGALTDSVAILFISRIIEGIGVGLIAIVGPALISMWFPVAKRGLPMGMWGSWMMVSQAIIFLVAGRITIKYGWQGVWWFVTAVCVIVAILYAWKVVSPPAGQNHADSENSSISFKEGFKHKGCWFLSGAGMMFCFSCFGFANWIAPYWAETFMWDINYANDWVSRLYTIEIPMVIFIGWVLDKLGNKRKIVSVSSYAFYAVILYFCFRMTNPAMIVPFVLVYALLEGAVPTSLWTLCPQTVRDPSLAGIAFGILAIGMNLGSVLGPPATGYLIENYGWHAGGLAIAASAAIGMAMMAMVRFFTQEEQDAALAECRR